MANNLIKVLGIGGGIATVGGGVTAIYLTSNSAKTEQEQSLSANPPQAPATDPIPSNVETKQKISDLLKGKKLLSKTDSDNTKWQPQWNAFKKAHEQNPPTSPWNFTDWARIKDIETTINTFKDQCDNHSKQLVTGEQDPVFVAVKTYCIEKEDAGARQ